MVMDWLRTIASRSPKLPELKAEPERHVDILLSAERDAILASHLNEPLAALGLVQVAPRRWVDGSAPPARRVFEMRLLKSAGIMANWGFSLDFVPHISGRRICWHRSDRTAMLDVHVDPRGLEKACFLWGAEWLHRDLDRLVPVAVERAQETWRQGSTWTGMLDILQEIRERKSNRFSFHFYWHLPLTFVFLTAKTGDLASAQAALEEFVRDRKLSEDIAMKLGKLVRDVAPV
jgi:hypothetical protein